MALIDGLVSYYKCDSSTSFPDSHNGFAGTITGATFTSSGQINGAYSYDGTNDKVETNMNLNATASVSVWIFPRDIAAAGGDYIFDGRTASGVGYCFINASTVLTSGGTIYVDGVVGSVIVQDVWQHIAVTGISLNTSEFQFGARFNDAAANFIDATIDEIGIWDRTLSAGEVTSLYNSGAGFAYPFTTGYGNTVIGVVTPAVINGIAVANITSVNGV